MAKLLKLDQIKTENDLKNIMFGGVFLGSGGGGPIAAGEYFIGEIAERLSNNPLEVIQVDEVEANAYGTTTAFVGSPAQGVSGIDLKSPLYSFKQMEIEYEHEFIYPMSIETGGANSLVPIVTAVFNDEVNFLIDGDGAGRAVPTIQNTLYANTGGILYDKTVVSNSAKDNKKLSTVIKFSDQSEITAGDVEKNCLNIIKSELYNDEGGMTVFSVPGKLVSECIVPGMFSEMFNIGHCILDSSEKLDDLLKEYGYFIRKFEGTVDEIIKPNSNVIERKINENLSKSEPLDIGSVKILNSNGDFLKLFYLNENLIALTNEIDIKKASKKNIWAMAPDLICYFVEKSVNNPQKNNKPVSNVEIEKGDVVIIYGLSAKAVYRNNQGVVNSLLDVLADKNNGIEYKGDYYKIEDLAEEQGGK